MREFRVHFDEFVRAGARVACVTRESVEANRRWTERLEIPYPILADVDGDAGRALGVNRAVGLGPWTLELTRRSTLLVDARGEVAAVWSKVKIRGHAQEVLTMVRASGTRAPAIPESPSPPAA